MALSSKITEVHIRNIGDTWEYRFTPKDANSELGQENYTGSAFDEAIDASLRSNFRGFRLSVTLNWAKLTDTTVYDVKGASNSTVGEFFDDLITTFTTDGDDYVEISFTQSGTKDYNKIIPESLNYKTSYTNQIGRGSSNLSFIGQELLTTIPAELEAPSV